MTQEEQSKKKKFEGIMTLIGWDYKAIAQATGHTYGSIKKMLSPKEILPRWCNLIVDLFKEDSLKSHVMQNMRLDSLSQNIDEEIIRLSKEDSEKSMIELKLLIDFSGQIFLIRQQ